MKKDTILKDFDKVIKILNSSKNQEHLNVSVKCFNLWQTKHSKMFKVQSSLNKLKTNFWSQYKDMDNKVGLIQNWNS